MNKSTPVNASASIMTRSPMLPKIERYQTQLSDVSCDFGKSPLHDVVCGFFLAAPGRLISPSIEDDCFSRLLPAIDILVEYSRKLPVNGG